MTWRILQGDVTERLEELPDESVHCVVTSPPYWGLRDYGVAGQIGLEESFDEYLERLVSVFREVRRVLRRDGTCWVNMGDAYAGHPPRNDDRNGSLNRKRRDQPERPPQFPLSPKQLIGQPWRLAFALQAGGWWLRSDVIWHKPNPMPESVTDRPMKAHEYVFLLTKSARYWYDADSVREESTGRASGNVRENKGVLEDPTRFRTRSNLHVYQPSGRRNLRTVWTVPTQPFPEAHFATFPERLVEPCIKAGCPQGGTVLDPFSGAGTTGVVALRLQRSYIGIELNPEYAEMSRRRIREDAPLFNPQQEADDE